MIYFADDSENEYFNINTLHDFPTLSVSVSLCVIVVSDKLIVTWVHYFVSTANINDNKKRTRPLGTHIITYNVEDQEMKESFVCCLCILVLEYYSAPHRFRCKMSSPCTS